MSWLHISFPLYTHSLRNLRLYSQEDNLIEFVPPTNQTEFLLKPHILFFPLKCCDCIYDGQRSKAFVSVVYLGHREGNYPHSVFSMCLLLLNSDSATTLAWCWIGRFFPVYHLTELSGNFKYIINVFLPEKPWQCLCSIILFLHSKPNLSLSLHWDASSW